MNSRAEITIAPASPESANGREAVRRYLDDIISRFYGRQATDAEIDLELSEGPAEELAPPQGYFLIAHAGNDVVGCAGFRLIEPGLGEVRRVFVSPDARGRGVGARLLGEIERAALDAGLTRLRLDTRSDLVEARRLYTRAGYSEVERFNDSPYAQHWFAKSLHPSP
ncbi:GNAT family N-acetyltransferase [Glaciibacter superstes]|uniref:GNAT family N-acetyltransferase n=1 Tax=Glaciibacter superstes TaxID=501023 RepID=UPI0003B4187B|nr:GNAT family N-acetyltransferase [Glaciibacter superstes]